MNMEQLIALMTQQADKYAVESYENIIVGVKPARRHKKKRIQKKWIKRYGMMPNYQRKKCKVINITPQMTESLQAAGYCDTGHVVIEVK